MARLVPVGFDDLEGWLQDNHAAALAAFQQTAARALKQPFKTRGLGVPSEHFEACFSAALALNDVNDERARSFFEHFFLPHCIELNTVGKAADGQQGFLTGYFEPVVSASRLRTDQYCEPIYARPPDLVDVDDTNRPDNWPADMRFARQTRSGLNQYADRAAINAGALAGQGLEIAYVANRVEAFFIHVQGSACLMFGDGSSTRITYAAKSGHAYTSLGRELIHRLGVTPQDMTADRLKDWMLGHPEELDDLLAINRSYIFFKELRDLDPDKGPVGAAKVQLTTGRSLAVDRTLHTYGSPVWVASEKSLPGEQDGFARLMVAQDTGSAIVGPARGDIFMGSGNKAGLLAGKVQLPVDMYVFVPRSDGMR